MTRPSASASPGGGAPNATAMYAYDRTVINASAEGQDPRRLIKLRVEARDKTRAAGKVGSATDEKSSPCALARSDITGVTVEKREEVRENRARETVEKWTDMTYLYRRLRLAVWEEA